MLPLHQYSAASEHCQPRAGSVLLARSSIKETRRKKGNYWVWYATRYCFVFGFTYYLLLTFWVYIILKVVLIAREKKMI